MNILQLRDKLNDLLAAGVDSTLPVVIPTLEFDDRTLHIGELLKLEVRDNETYEYDSVKLAVQRKSGSVLALNFTNNDGWQNDSFGVTRVIEPVVPSIEKLSSNIDVFAKNDKGMINFEEFYHLPNDTIGAVVTAKALGHKYVFFNSPFGFYHEIVDNGTCTPGIISVDPKRVKLKPFNIDLYLKDYTAGIYSSDVEARKDRRLRCLALGMEEPSDEPGTMTASNFDKAKEV